jgi:alpha-tubulin suppressor-like RCC1 family protein
MWRVAILGVGLGACHSVVGFEERTYAEPPIDEPPVCTHGDVDCDGATPRACSDGSWQALAPCEGATPVCQEGSCTPGVAALAEGCAQSHMCLVGTDGLVRCWGDNAYGQLGTPGPLTSAIPQIVPGLADVVEVALGWTHSCARTAAGAVYCWGSNGLGQLGLAPSTSSFTPTVVLGIPAADAVRAAEHRTCIVSNGEVWCWGANETQQIQVPADSMAHAPTKIAGVADVKTLALGVYRSIGVLDDGTAVHWGDVGVAAPVPELAGVVDVRMCDLHHCALHEGGTISCWGIDQYGELGNGPPLEQIEIPDELRLTGVTDARVGWRFTCVMTTAGVRCVGHGVDGELGGGDRGVSSIAFVDVDIAPPIFGSSSTWATTCVWTGGADVACWGGNAAGTVGNGSYENQPAPVAVSWQ